MLRVFNCGLLWVKKSFILITSQSLYEEAAAAERSESDAEELCCLPQTQELAVVAAVHQGTVHTTTLQHRCEINKDSVCK